MKALILLIPSGIKLPIIDSKTDGYFENSIAKAGVAYATCRGINAIVSVLKGSDLDIDPEEIGTTIAVGEIFDPIDDMTERLSDVIVTAITSLGVQKLLYEISISFVMPIISILIFILSIKSNSGPNFLNWKTTAGFHNLQRPGV